MARVRDIARDVLDSCTICVKFVYDSCTNGKRVGHDTIPKMRVFRVIPCKKKGAANGAVLRSGLCPSACCHPTCRAKNVRPYPPGTKKKVLEAATRVCCRQKREASENGDRFRIDSRGALGIFFTFSRVGRDSVKRHASSTWSLWPTRASDTRKHSFAHPRVFV